MTKCEKKIDAGPEIAIQRIFVSQTDQGGNMFHVAAAVTPWLPEESTPLPARLPGLKFIMHIKERQP